jgi:hypothetical protein
MIIKCLELIGFESTTITIEDDAQYLDIVAGNNMAHLVYGTNGSTKYKNIVISSLIKFDESDKYLKSIISNGHLVCFFLTSGNLDGVE